MSDQVQISSDRREEQIDIRSILLRYLKNWKWFLASLIVTLSICFLYLRYTNPIYQSHAKLLIKYEKAGSYSELSAFKDLGLFEGASGFNNLYNEQEILKSRLLVSRAIINLGLDVQYNIIGTTTGIDRGELYNVSPIKIHFLNKDSLETDQFRLLINIVSESKYTIDDTDFKNVNFGEVIDLDDVGKFSIVKTDKFSKNTIKKIIGIELSPIDQVISEYKGNLNVEPLGEDMDILSLNIKGRSIEKNNDFINRLIEEHTLQTIEDQKKIYVNTTNFIDNRIKDISTELSDVEIDGQEYKTDFQFSDIYLNEKSLYDRVLSNERNLSSSRIQLELIDFMNDYLEENADNSTLLPVNLGLDNNTINNTVIEYNKIVLERERVVENSGTSNPQLKRLTQELEDYRSSLKSSLFNFKANLEIEVAKLENDEKELNAGISSLPKHKRIVRSIERQQEVKEALYIYLLQKREENEIAGAITEGNSKVIESAYSDGRIVSPNRKLYFGFALFMGMFVPFFIITAFAFFDNKLKSKDDLKPYHFSYLGAIPRITSDKKQVINDDVRTPVSEAFRILRTNTSFLLGTNEKDSAKTILITSTIAQEGKSVISLNLAVSYALTQKKTVVVGFDLRAPRLSEYAGIGSNKQSGVTEYLMNSKSDLDALLVKSDTNEYLYFLPSGHIPPNPSELILRSKTEELIEELKKAFDVIIIDSAPIGLVSDSLSLAKYSDAVLYVAKVNFLDKRYLEIPEKYISENKLNNVGFILNNVEHDEANPYGYGYSFGYGEGVERKSWWQKILKRN